MVKEQRVERILGRVFASLSGSGREGTPRIPRKEWTGILEELDVPEIARVITGLGAGGSWVVPGPEEFREAARAVIDQKIAERLDASASRLGRIGIGLGFVQVVLAVVSVCLAIHFGRG